MIKKRQIAIIALPVLVVMMIGVYHVLASFFGRETAWYAGFWIYWPIWCVLFPGWMLGWKKFRELFQHRKLNAVGWFLFFFPIAMALIGRFVMPYDKADMWGRLILIFMAFANGILEEILWRGVYFTLFPDNIRWGFVWPTLWFALWHLAPGSVSVSFSPWVLMAGAVVFGACWGWIAMKTDSIRWSAISHTLTALVRVLG